MSLCQPVIIRSGSDKGPPHTRDKRDDDGAEAYITHVFTKPPGGIPCAYKMDGLMDKARNKEEKAKQDMRQRGKLSWNGYGAAKIKIKSADAFIYKRYEEEGEYP